MFFCRCACRSNVEWVVPPAGTPQKNDTSNCRNCWRAVCDDCVGTFWARSMVPPRYTLDRCALRVTEPVCGEGRGACQEVAGLLLRREPRGSDRALKNDPSCGCTLKNTSSNASQMVKLWREPRHNDRALKKDPSPCCGCTLKDASSNTSQMVGNDSIFTAESNVTRGTNCL